MHTSHRVKVSVVFSATVWSALVIMGDSFMLPRNEQVDPPWRAPHHHHHHHHHHHSNEQGAAFNRDCKLFPNKRIIMVTPNAQYWDVFRNWFHHAKDYMGEHDQLVVVAQDEGIVTMLRQNRSFVFVDLDGNLNDPTVGNRSTRVPGPFEFMSPEFNSLTGRRPAQILSFLKLNCTVLYSDVDSVWLGDVFQDVAKAGSHDLYITDDTIYNNSIWKNKWNFCTCFIYAQPSPSVQVFVQAWANAVSENTNDQPPFNQVLKRDYLTRKLVDFAQLPFDAFPSGCAAKRFWGTSAVRVLHANCRVGLETKIQFLKAHGSWIW